MHVTGVYVPRLRRTNPSRVRTPAYVSWRSMVTRCFNKDHKHYSFYGGRGITVCDRWRSFENFLADMGERPEGTTLDRIDGDGIYEPSNCRWATKREQQNNLRVNRHITVDGRTQTVAQWARELGINRSTIYVRLHKGWSDQDALKPLVPPAHYPRLAR